VDTVKKKQVILRPESHKFLQLSLREKVGKKIYSDGL
jgi:hypothetical protein